MDCMCFKYTGRIKNNSSSSYYYFSLSSSSSCMSMAVDNITYVSDYLPVFTLSGRKTYRPKGRSVK